MKIFLKPENISSELIKDNLIEGTRLEQQSINFYQIQSLIQQILEKLNMANNILNQSALEKMKAANLSSLNKELKIELYTELKKMQNVEIYMQNAYLLIQQLRQYFTGQVIKYNYAIKYYDTTYNFDLTLEQLMSLKSLGQQFNFKGSLGNLIKLRFDKKGKLATLNDILAILQKNDLSEFAIKDNLYENIRESFPKENEGNLYEAYLVFKNRFGDKFQYLNIRYKKVFENILNNTRSNLISSTQGPDIINNNVLTSVKSYIKSAPSLINIQQLTNTLITLQNIFQNYNNSKNSKQMAEEIINLYTKDLTAKAHKNAINFAEQKINELIKDLIK